MRLKGLFWWRIKLSKWWIEDENKSVKSGWNVGSNMNSHRLEQLIQTFFSFSTTEKAKLKILSSINMTRVWISLFLSIKCDLFCLCVSSRMTRRASWRVNWRMFGFVCRIRGKRWSRRTRPERRASLKSRFCNNSCRCAKQTKPAANE